MPMLKPIIGEEKLLSIGLLMGYANVCALFSLADVFQAAIYVFFFKCTLVGIPGVKGYGTPNQ